MIRWKSWHRWSALCLLAYIYLAVAVAVHRDSDPGPEIGLIPITIPELVRLLRDTVIPPPCQDKTWTRPTAGTGHNGDAATNTAHARLISAGTPTPTPHHDHNDLQPP